MLHERGRVKTLRILYAAIDQTVPGTLGGSVHVRAVAEGWRRWATKCTRS
jgi:hypothetical protein